MSDDIKLFEMVGGLLRQIAPDLADAARTNRRVGRIHTVIDVLWTPEEEAAADAAAAEQEAKQAADRAAIEAAVKAAQEASSKRAAMIESATAKLRTFGLTEDEIKAISAQPIA